MADQTTRIGLDERRRFVRLAANHRRPLSRDPVWQTTSVVVLDAATVEMMSDRIEPADTLTFGDAERSRVPWLHLPTLVVPAEPVTGLHRLHLRPPGTTAIRSRGRTDRLAIDVGDASRHV